MKGEKNNTWRLFDDKNLVAGDDISLVVKETLQEFAQAKIISISETTFTGLTEDDWDGHEKYEKQEEMYKDYSGYYGREVDKDTLVKIVKFKLI